MQHEHDPEIKSHQIDDLTTLHHQETQLILADDCDLEQLFNKLLRSSANLYDSSDWCRTLTAIASGLFSALVYYGPTNQLIDNGVYPEWLRYPFLAGTMGTNAILNTFFVRASLLLEKILLSSFTKSMGIKFDGWGTKKHILILLIAVLSGMPFSLLSYEPEKSSWYNLLMLPPQAIIYLSLQLFGAAACYEALSDLYTHIFSPSNNPYNALANNIIKNLTKKTENLEELAKFMQGRDTHIESITFMMQNVADNTKFLPDQNIQPSQEFFSEFLSNPDLKKNRTRPNWLTYLDYCLKAAVIMSSIAAAGGFVWSTKKSATELTDNELLGWFLSIFANFFFTCTVISVSCDVAGDVSSALYNFLKPPIQITEDNLSFNQRTKLAMARTMPYSMTNFPLFSISATVVMLILSNFSFAASVDLQEVFMREVAHFMQKSPAFWMGNVQFNTVLFNFSAAPILIEKFVSALSIQFLTKSAVRSHKDIKGLVQITLNALNKMINEHRLTDSESVVALWRDCLNLPQCKNDSEVNLLLNSFHNNSKLRTFYQMISDNENDATIENGEFHLSISERNRLKRALTADLKEHSDKIRVTTYRNWLFRKEKPPQQDESELPLLEL